MPKKASDEINEAYARAVEARQRYAQRVAATIAARANLQNKEAEHVRAGAMEGLKNETAREAHLRGMCAIESAMLTGCEVDEARDRGAWEAAELEVRRVEALLRLAEIENGVRS